MSENNSDLIIQRCADSGFKLLKHDEEIYRVLASSQNGRFYLYCAYPKLGSALPSVKRLSISYSDDAETAEYILLSQIRGYAEFISRNSPDKPSIIVNQFSLSSIMELVP